MRSMGFLAAAAACVMGVAVATSACSSDDATSLGGRNTGNGVGDAGPVTSGNDAAVDSSGTSGLPGGTPQWGAHLGGIQADSARGIAFDGSGSALLAGTFAGSADLAGVAFTSAGLNDIFVAKYTAAGKASWVRRFGGGADDNATAIAADAAGNVYIAGTFQGTVDFGGGPLTAAMAAPASDVFLLKLDPFGNHVFSKRFGGAPAGPVTLALDLVGNVVLAGDYTSPPDFGAGPLAAPTGPNDLFIAKLDGNGTLVFAKRLGGDGVEAARGVAVDGAGAILLVGGFTGTADFGAGALASAGDVDVFAAKITGTGDTVWSRRFGGAEGDTATAVAVDSTGDGYIVGSFRTVIDFAAKPASGTASTASATGDGGVVDAGPASATALASAGESDAFVAKISSAGDPMFSVRFGGPRPDEARAVGVDRGSHVIVGGSYQDTMTVAGVPFVSAGDRDAFVLGLSSAAGAAAWGKHFGGPGTEETVAIAIDGSGASAIAGNYASDVDFGTGALTTVGASDVFVAKLAP